jgi:hypothetical protein
MISEKIFNTNGIIKIYTSDFKIFSDSHCKVFLDDVEVSATKYDIINNSVVFHTIPVSEQQLKLLVGTTPDDLLFLGSLNSSGIKTVGNIDVLRTSTITHENIKLLGYYNSTDGGGGDFQWNETSTETDNGGSIIKVNDIETGRWIKYNEILTNVKSFGAKGDGINNDTANIVLAINEGAKILIPSGNFICNPTIEQTETLLSCLDNIECIGTLDITLPAGTITLTNEVVVNSSTANNITINGQDITQTSLASISGITGSVKDYNITYIVNDGSNIEVGDYILNRVDVEGTNGHTLNAGIWEVITVATNHITVKNRSQSQQIESSTITGGTVGIIKTVIKFNGCDGFRFEGGQPLGELNHIAIVGDYNTSNDTGTEGTHGVITSSPIVHSGESSNAVFNPLGAVKLGETFGVSSFGEQGIACSGRTSLVGNYVASCSNRKRGVYSEGANMRMKFSTTNGNGEDGFISDVSGAITCAYAISSGNGLNGFWSTNNSFLGAACGKSHYNKTNGAECRGLGRLQVDGCSIIGNEVYGVSATDGGMIDADNCSSTYNINTGFYASSGGIIDADNSTSTDNGGYGYVSEYSSIVRTSGNTNSNNTDGDYFVRSNSTLFKSDGSLAINSMEYSISPRWYHINDNYWSPMLSSTGDLYFGGTFGNKIVLKNDGVFMPANDNDKSLGRASNRWSEVFAVNGTINTSDEREKQQIRTLNDKEKAVAIKLKNAVKVFKWNDAVETKGSNARIHTGFIAQEVRDIFISEDLNPEEYGLFTYDEWEEEVNDNGDIITQSGNRYGIRYNELLTFIITTI